MPDNKKVSLRHVGIVTNNIENMIKDFQAKGLHVKSDGIEHVRIVKFEEGVELLQYESQSETNLRRLGISHVAFTFDCDGNPVEEVHALDE